MSMKASVSIRKQDFKHEKVLTNGAKYAVRSEIEVENWIVLTLQK